MNSWTLILSTIFNGNESFNPDICQGQTVNLPEAILIYLGVPALVPFVALGAAAAAEGNAAKQAPWGISIYRR